MIKNNKGITLVSLVVTIIILIILAGVSINMILGERGLITIARRAKENMEFAQIEEQEKLNALFSQLDENGITEGDTNYEAISKLNNFKKQIADYIEEAGGIKPDYTANAETFGERIKGIVKEVTKNATATEEDITEGKTAWVNGELITGKKVNNVPLNVQGSVCFYKRSDLGVAININSGTPIILTNINNYAICKIKGTSDCGSIYNIVVYIDDTAVMTISDTLEHTLNLENNSKIRVTLSLMPTISTYSGNCNVYLELT